MRHFIGDRIERMREFSGGRKDGGGEKIGGIISNITAIRALVPARAQVAAVIAIEVLKWPSQR